MDVFDLRERLVQDYRRYAESFLSVKDERIAEHLQEELGSGLLSRRVRNACGSSTMRMVGTSATLAGPGSFEEQRTEVAAVASRIFGVPVLAESVVGETLRTETDDADLEAPEFKSALTERVRRGRPSDSLQEFVADPLACWIERTFGIRWNQDDERYERCDPMPISGEKGASRRLSESTG